MISNEDCTEKQRCPKHRDRNDFDSQWDGLVFQEVCNIWPQFRVIKQPVIEISVAA